MKMAQQVPERQDPRLVLDDGQEDDAEGGLHRCQRVELVEDHLRVLAALELHDDPDPLAVALVAQVRDPFELLVVDELGDALHELGLVDLVGNLRDDDGFLVPAGGLLHDRTGADLDDPPPRLVGVADSLSAVDEPGGGEVRPRNPLHELAEGGVGVPDHLDGRVDDLGEVVRRDVGRHAHRDARGAVDEQVGILGREDRRLAQRSVVVRHPVDRVLLEVLGEQLFGQTRQADFRVPVGRRVVAVQGTEVPLSVHERVPHREVLRHADDRVVDGRIAVRVVLAHDVPDDARGFSVRLVVGVALVPHAVQAAAMDRLQPVADVGERPSDDDGHGVVEVGAADLLLDRDRNAFFGGQ